MLDDRGCHIRGSRSGGYGVQMEYRLKLKAGNEMDKCVFLFIYLSFAKQQRLVTKKKR